MNKEVIVSAQYKYVDSLAYIVTIKAKNERNEMVFNQQQKCKLMTGALSLSWQNKERLIKKNIRNILTREKHIATGTKVVISLTHYGDVPPQVANPDVDMHAKEGYFTVKDPKTYGDIRDQRIWQVVLLNGNPTIVRARNPYLSSQEAKELLFKKILGEQNG